MIRFARSWWCHLAWVLVGFVWCAGVGIVRGDDTKVRELVVKAILAGEGVEQQGLVRSLVGVPGSEATRLLTLWKEGEIFLVEDGGKKVPVVLGDPAQGGKRPAIRLLDGAPVLDGTGKPSLVNPLMAETAETDAALRQVMKQVHDLAGLADPVLERRKAAIQAIGLQQSPAHVALLEDLRGKEKDAGARRLLDEALAFSRLASPDRTIRLEACRAMARLQSIAGRDALLRVRRAAEAAGDKELVLGADTALAAIEQHLQFVNTAGTLFRGVSQGSILLIVAIGLAITFGLMGVINMAHGELMVVGAYTAYLVQNIFEAGLTLSPFGRTLVLPGLGLSGAAADSYFLVAVPAAFVMAALVGLVMERTVIRFLYSRPLESLLATWGVSLVLQQLFRLVFGANNVQVSSPAWLAGNWTVQDVILGWNRVFVIGFAALIVLGTWLLLTRTPLGLLIRAVMQNRSMASCMGVPVRRVNMATFAFGSGLAGLAGAFLSQIGNVGPSLGQSYIVDAFMTVVVGGVGSLFGTVLSAVGIGLADQTLQQTLGSPVMGKILVLVAIILFLQWKPSGLFVARSRSLDQA